MELEARLEWRVSLLETPTYSSELSSPFPCCFTGDVEEHRRVVRFCEYQVAARLARFEKLSTAPGSCVLVYQSCYGAYVSYSKKSWFALIWRWGL